MIVYFYMKTTHDSPHIIPEKSRVFVLCSTVVRVKLGILFSEAVLFKKIVHIRNSTIRPFTSQNAPVYLKVHLPRNGFAADAKDPTLSRSFKIDRARLIWVTRVV